MLIGIDLGGTKIEGAVFDEQGQIIFRHRVPTPQTDYLATLDSIASLVNQLEQQIPYAERPEILGIATPGSVSKATGKMKNCNSTCLNHQPLQQDLEHLLKREIRLANDADCFVLSEAIDGAGKGVANVFGVILGTGVGGGICINQQLVAGPNTITGEWGHNPMPQGYSEVNDQRPPHSVRTCYCGKIDCVETYLSGQGLEESYRQMTGERASVQLIVDRASNGEKTAKKALKNYQELLARALSVVINVLDPEVIVLGGGLSNIESLYKEVPRRWSDYVFSDEIETKLLPAMYGDSSGVRGAAWLAR